jgi:predicted  nucleic acid-binding Zn-ribbon protein
MMMHERLALLFQVQTQDRTIEEFSARLARLAARQRELEERISQRQAELAEKRRALDELRRESHRRNDEVDSLDYQMRNYEKQLRESILSYREMEALKEKLDWTRRRMEELADGAIGLMNEIEAREEQLAREAEELGAWERGVRQEIARVVEETAARQAELEKARERRAALAAQVERHLLEQYERLLRDYHYDEPIARVEGDSCSGCKMWLSENTRDRVREGRELVVCENCHRILYWE